MATIKGKGFRWSTGGLSFTAGVVSGTSKAYFDRWNLKRSADKFILKDDNASRVGEAFYDPIKTFTCAVVPYADDTIANGQTSVDAWGLAPGTKMTLVDSKGTVIDGDYVLDDAEIIGEKEGAVMVGLTMHKSDDNDISTTVS
jgi:hypothetical protein